MNERVQELWQACVLKHTLNPMNWQTVADEFAELIVQECLLALEPNWYASEIDYEFEQRFFDRCSRILKKHLEITGKK